MGTVSKLWEQPLKRTALDASKWRSFAIAYYDENGNLCHAYSAKSDDEAVVLLREAMLKLNVDVFQLL
jgi:hypothetical protein